MQTKTKPAWPVLQRYDADHLLRIAMPLGGIGTGTVSLGGRGNLQDWEIVNRPAKGFVPKNAFFALYAKAAAGKAVARAIEGQIDPSKYEGAFGCLVPNHMLPRFAKREFAHAYPLAQVNLSDPSVPVSVRLEAFNPLIPVDADSSGMPVAVLRYVLTNRTNQRVSASVCGSLENFVGTDGSNLKPNWVGVPEHGHALKSNFNTFQTGGGVSGISMATRGVDPLAEQWGTIALSAVDAPGQHVSHRTAWANLTWGDSLLDFWDDFSEDGMLDEREQGETQAPTGSLAVSVNLAPKATRAITFLLTWHFPNRQTWTTKPAPPAPATTSQTSAVSLAVSNECCTGGECGLPDRIGNYYTTQYADAWDVAIKVAPQLRDLERRTVEFVQSFVESNLPQPIKDAALCNISTLRTQTCFRTEDGRFYGWEGCGDGVGCCHGSCTHVWNYEQATAFLFGSLSRSMREVEFGHCVDARGRMSFRANLPLDRATEWGVAAADGQMGCIVKLYRDFRLSGDRAMLDALWPNARKALEFCWIPGGWDADRDGVMEGCQHNTMDVEYYGPNAHMSILYLAALRSAEEMARVVGDAEFANACRQIFESGQREIDKTLFNGEYYDHHIVPIPNPDDIAKGLRHESMGSKILTDPDFQIGPGCEVNQLFGQQLAHVAGLGELVNSRNVRTALRSIMKHNFRENLTGHFNHLRSYALGDEAGLLMCTWPRGGRPKRPFPYANEVWTGLEYLVASHLMYEGLPADGLRIIEAARARHDGAKRNPFNEPECGHHYARAMASWATVLAASGFMYDATNGLIEFVPTKNSSQFFWSTGDAWGTFGQSPSRKGVAISLEVLGGAIEVKRISIRGEGEFTTKRAGKLSSGAVLRGNVPTVRSRPKARVRGR